MHTLKKLHAMLFNRHLPVSLCALASTTLILLYPGAAIASPAAAPPPAPPPAVEVSSVIAATRSILYPVSSPNLPLGIGKKEKENEPAPTPAAAPHTAQEVVELLGLTPSNEKGYFLETFRDEALVPGTNRSMSTAIYYLLEGSEGFSNWHRVLDAAEVWHWYAGAPLSLYLSLDDGQPIREHVLGPDVFAFVGNSSSDDQKQQRPQAIVAKNEWQRARSWGDWTLVGTTGK